MDIFENLRKMLDAGKISKEDIERAFPQLAESEDERIRKAILGLTYIDGIEPILTKCSITAQDIRAYLEKQKEQKEELVYRLNGLMQDYIKEGKDDEEKKHRLKCYQLFWDALEDISFFEQKEQKLVEYPEKGNGYWFGFNEGKGSVLDHPEEYGLIKPADVSKKIEELCSKYPLNKGVMSKQELSAYRQGLSFGATKIAEYFGEQKPAEWSKEDLNMIGSIRSTIELDIQRDGKLPEIKKAHEKELKWFDDLYERNISAQKQEWSEEDKIMLNSIIRIIHMKSIMPLDEMDDRSKYEKYEDFLKSLPERFNLQSKQEWSKEDKLPIDAAVYWLEKRLETEEVRDISTRTCPLTMRETIEKLKSLRPYPHWKPSEQEKGALRTAISILTEERHLPKAAAHLQAILNVFEGKESRKDWKPSKEQVNTLKVVARGFPADDLDAIDSLLTDLQKLL